METKLEGIAAKARKETNLKFTSLCHHVTRELIWESLCNIPNDSAPGVDGITVEEAKKDFGLWIGKMLQSIHRKGYKAPPVRRVWIPKPGKTAKRPLGVPCVADRALQRSVSTVLSCMYEQDFLPCSFGGRPNLSAHHALATLKRAIGTSIKL
jgi:RNA-directed DNA polymerase